MDKWPMRDDEAVSPVIATVLLLAITVMLSSMVFIVMQGAINSVEKSEPDLTVSVKGLSNGFHVVRITSLDQALDPARLEYQIYSQDDLNSKEFSGFVDDIDVYGAIGSNVSFHDRDAGYSVTQGDYFVIDSETIGAKDGTWSMKLIDQSSNVMLFDVKLVLIQD
ncbi:MAG TPA: type IV pilin [Candidatus Poseidoniaceae archaeon]|nr:MAG TPA: type IV pilin [Candidatus Poseidoniales archaeon]HII37898.1 type IV pilin [Candidatus Poseidoniaceae archaeon]